VTPSTVMAAPVATQRSCWRSTPCEARNRRTTQSRAAGRDAMCRARPATAMPLATWPRRPGCPKGLSKGTGVSEVTPGIRKAPTTNMTGPATAVAATTRQRGDRSRPSGTSSAGKVTPRAMAGAQTVSSATAASWASRGSGRCSRTSWSSHGSRGMTRLQVSAEAAYSQPIGLAGRRRVRTRPTVAYPSGTQRAKSPPSSRTWAVSGRETSSATTSPATHAAMVASHRPQAATVLVRGCSLIASSTVGSLPGRSSQTPGTRSLRPQSSSAIRVAARAAPSVSTGR
jgi:hypothetical protein